MRRLIVCCFWVFLLIASIADAAVPQKISYQGMLTNATGTPVNATVSMTFALYNVASGGTALWSEIQSVIVSKGIYNVSLGAVNPITLPFDTQYYLGVKIGADAEMTPRSAMNSVGYAINSSTANNISPQGNQSVNYSVKLSAGEEKVIFNTSSIIMKAGCTYSNNTTCRVWFETISPYSIIYNEFTGTYQDNRYYFNLGGAFFNLDWSIIPGGGPVATAPWGMFIISNISQIFTLDLNMYLTSIQNINPVVILSVKGSYNAAN